MSKMSSIEIHPSHQIGGGLLNTVLEALQAFANRMAYARQLYRDYLHLSAMSEPELQDIGISRSDISAVLAGTYRRVERPPAKANSGIKLAVPTGGNNRDRRRTSCVED